MKLKNKKIKCCRLCGSDKFSKLYDLGNLYVSNFVDIKYVRSSPKAPLVLIKCNNCKLIQLQHTAPMELMYRGYYWYKSGVTKTMRNNLEEISNLAKRFLKSKKNNVILDIGANDGTLLKNFNRKKYITVGCEPAKNLKKDLVKNCKYSINDFWDKKKYFALAKKKGFSKAKVVTALGMFYDLEDPNKFISDIEKVLDDKGIFIAQLMCLRSMLDTTDLGNICHEHLEFYSYETLKFMFERNNLEIFKISENKINAGSYRIFARKLKKGSINFKEDVSNRKIKEFIKNVENSKKQTVNFIKNKIREGKKIFVYGASTKGNTILQHFGIDNKLINYAADRSPSKWGKYTVGTGIKIISEEDARKMKPDYFLILPWGFLNEFRKRESKFLASGGKFIIPFPKFRILKN